MYYFEKPNLHYTTKEHIIPAGLGGQATLPKGFVSDEFNTAISALELEFLRESIYISLPRQILGPGSRGKLGEKHETRSKVHVLFKKEDETDPALGFVKKAKSYLIPHVVINSLTGQITLGFNNADVADRKSAIEEFQEKCKNFAELKTKIINTNDLPEHITLFGIQAGLEGSYNSFFASNEHSTVKYSREMVAAVSSVVFNSEEFANSISIPLSKQTAIFNVDHLRINAKIAFNYLASIKGYDFVTRNEFDPIRQYIATGGDNKFVAMDLKSLNIFSNAEIDLPSSSHFIYMVEHQNQIIVYLSLYNHFNTYIYLPAIPGDAVPNTGLICDHINRKEITLEKYVQEQTTKTKMRD
jgi:hypothetical protein